ncbi:cell wall-binding repeat-containing protein [Clostridium sp. CF012]|uniref:cell wall-binding repeat-containing protein n=1 Tax=Clostridium sp. CF012 TaxID=2843319 RepID=UPI001C0DC709|nr:cell wall-binding repeat-containing protein [Clostridium sp. CF012]MBU3143481.1 cell wall-binding repeat-containing protein [Clostridium sp. CF012]
MKKRRSIIISCLIIVFLLQAMNVQVFAGPVVNVTSISLNKITAVLSVNAVDTLIATVSPATATNQTVTWTSSNTDIVKVFNGVVMAVSPGTAMITVTSVDGFKNAACMVVVSKADTAISLNKTSGALTLYDSETLVATVNQSVGTSQTVTWASSNNAIVRVDNGLIIGVGEGTAVITATAVNGGNIASCVVKVSSPVISINLNKSSDYLTVGGSDVLTVSVNPSTSTNQTVTWASSDTSIVQVTDGILIAVSAGSATITATTIDGSKKATCSVIVNGLGTVGSKVTSISLNKTSGILNLGSTDTLIATINPNTASNQTITWSSSNTAVANVVNGVVIPISAGSAIITAKSVDGDKTASCIVVVNASGTIGSTVTSISLNKTSGILNLGSTDTLIATINPATASNKTIIWSSSNTAVANVVNGVVTPISAGSAIITATSVDGNKTSSCIVVVNAASKLNLVRLGGANRYQTATAISQSGWKTTSSYAVLATGNDYPDALSAAPLAKKYNAPILLTEKNSIPQIVITELKRLSVTRIFITGGTGVVSQAVESQLKTMGITTERLGGTDRFETSIKIAEKLGVGSGEIMVTNGMQYSDALSASSIAAKKGIPIILANKDALPASTNTFISKKSFTKTYILGDTDLISDNVANKFPRIERIVGSDKYERNINIIKRFESDISFSNICVATGKDFPDALSGSAIAAMYSTAIVLVDDSALKDITTKYISGKLAQVNNVYIFGLQGAVSDAVIKTLFNK